MQAKLVRRSYPVCQENRKALPPDRAVRVPYRYKETQ
jgi:hypothetical protein